MDLIDVLHLNLCLSILIEELLWSIKLFLLFVWQTFGFFNVDLNEDGTRKSNSTQEEEHALRRPVVHHEFHCDGFFKEGQE